jgi:hypothetical protein
LFHKIHNVMVAMPIIANTNPIAIATCFQVDSWSFIACFPLSVKERRVADRLILNPNPSRKRMFILRGADHQHFADEIGDPGLCSPEHAHLFTRSLGLAHFDAVLNGNAAARRFMEDDPAARLRERGSTPSNP